jgi:hypothetical protein
VPQAIVVGRWAKFRHDLFHDRVGSFLACKNSEKRQVVSPIVDVITLEINLQLLKNTAIDRFELLVHELR